MTQDQIEREIEIAAPPERVWSLITEAEHVGQWFGETGAELDLRPGGALAVHWESGHTIHGQVVTVEPHTTFAWRWMQAAGAPEDTPEAEYDPARSTLVEFTLEPSGDGTLLRVVESGFASLEGTATPAQELFASHTKGWPMEIGELADYATKVAV